MPKPSTGDWLTHPTGINSDTPTIALCMRAVRVDGVEHLFTSHDENLTVGGKIYKASNGFSRTALESASDLVVDGIEIIGLLNATDLPEEVFTKGLLDGAEVELFRVNYETPDSGMEETFAGIFGEVREVGSGRFVIELRALTQYLKAELAQVRTAGCRVDLGDPVNCRVPIEPALRADGATYAVGDFIRVPTASDQLIFDAGLVNGGFEADGLQTANTTNLTGWNVTFGQINTLSAWGDVRAHSGTYFLVGGNSNNHQLHQDIDLTLATDFVAANVDAGDADALFSIFRNAPDFAQIENERARVYLEARDGASALISTLFDTGFVAATIETWTRHEFDGVLPSGTRKIRIGIQWSSPGGSGNEDITFDSTSLLIRDRAQAGGTSFRFEDRIYECIEGGDAAVGQPAYATAIDAETQDGTARFAAREAFTAAAWVEAGGEDGKTFAISPSLLTSPRFQAAAAFDFGGIAWETGQNSGWLSEVKTAALPAVELKHQTPFPILPGDAFRMHLGCDKQRDGDCLNTFVIPNSRDFPLGNVANLKGEPDAPGKALVFQV